MGRLYAFLSKYSTVAVIIFDILVQLILIGKFLDNSVISSYAPTAADAGDYTNRAELWKNQGFVEAFDDAFRMPGYPSIILLMSYVVPFAPNLAVRILQMFAVALSVGLIKIVLQKIVSLRISLLGSVLYILLPIWHFVPILIAEALTSVIVVVIIWLLTFGHNLEFTKLLILKISTFIAIAVYLKPNNFLLIFSVIGFIVFSKSSHPFRNTAKLFSITLLTLLPWIFFASNSQPGFIGLTTTFGSNLYVGTGMHLDYNGDILSQSAIRWKVDPKSNPSDVIDDETVGTPAELDALYKHKAIEIWGKRPLNVLGFGIDKTLIAFGIKANSAPDHIFGIFSVLALFGSLILLRTPALRPWGSATLFMMLGLAAQAFMFQADRRFVVPVFLPFATVCLGIVLGNIPQINRRKPSDSVS